MRLVLTRGKPILELLRFQVEADGLWAKSNMGDLRYVAVHPAGLYAHHARELANCQVLVFHSSTSSRS
jgi:hypothetical protein